MTIIEEQTLDYKDITFKNKLFRIVEWEDKLLGDIINKDFSCRLFKGFRLVDFQEFNDLIWNNKIKLKTWKGYIIKHFNELQWVKPYCLSRVFLFSNGGLSSYYRSLGDTDDSGRVVFVRDLGEMRTRKQIEQDTKSKLDISNVLSDWVEECDLCFTCFKELCEKFGLTYANGKVYDSISTKKAPSDVIIERAGNMTKHGQEAIRAVCGTDEEYQAYVDKYKEDTLDVPNIKCPKCNHNLKQLKGKHKIAVQIDDTYSKQNSTKM